MAGPFNSLAAKVSVFSGDFPFCFSSLDHRVFVLAGEVGEGSKLARRSVIEMSIFGSPVPSSCSPTSKPLLSLPP
jgi:hypothetical protein